MGIEDEVKERFVKDIATHEIKILRDEELNRYIQFRRPGTYTYAFDVITWPGYLCCCGDMGTYVFTRIPDMFEFFRNDSKKDGLYINSGYWSEKCVAMDKNNQIEKYSAELFRKRIVEWMDEGEVDPETRQAVEDEVLCHVDDGEYSAMRAAMDFEHKGFSFTDFWEVGVKEYNYTYIWCLYAIALVIKNYDRIKAENTK